MFYTSRSPRAGWSSIGWPTTGKLHETHAPFSSLHAPGTSSVMQRQWRLGNKGCTNAGAARWWRRRLTPVTHQREKGASEISTHEAFWGGVEHLVVPRSSSPFDLVRAALGPPCSEGGYVESGLSGRRPQGRSAGGPLTPRCPKSNGSRWRRINVNAGTGAPTTRMDETVTQGTFEARGNPPTGMHACWYGGGRGRIRAICTVQRGWFRDSGCDGGSGVSAALCFWWTYSGERGWTWRVVMGTPQVWGCRCVWVSCRRWGADMLWGIISCGRVDVHPHSSTCSTCCSAPATPSTPALLLSCGVQRYTLLWAANWGEMVGQQVWGTWHTVNQRSLSVRELEAPFAIGVGCSWENSNICVFSQTCLPNLRQQNVNSMWQGRTKLTSIAALFTLLRLSSMGQCWWVSKQCWGWKLSTPYTCWNELFFIWSWWYKFRFWNGSIYLFVCIMVLSLPLL